jgi:hypothetical protein
MKLTTVRCFSLCQLPASLHYWTVDYWRYRNRNPVNIVSGPFSTLREVETELVMMFLDASERQFLAATCRKLRQILVQSPRSASGILRQHPGHFRLLTYTDRVVAPIRKHRADMSEEESATASAQTDTIRESSTALFNLRMEAAGAIRLILPHSFESSDATYLADTFPRSKVVSLLVGACDALRSNVGDLNFLPRLLDKLPKLQQLGLQQIPSRSTANRVEWMNELRSLSLGFPSDREDDLELTSLLGVMLRKRQLTELQLIAQPPSSSGIFRVPSRLLQRLGLDTPYVYDWREEAEAQPLRRLHLQGMCFTSVGPDSLAAWMQHHSLRELQELTLTDFQAAAPNEQVDAQERALSALGWLRTLRLENVTHIGQLIRHLQHAPSLVSLHLRLSPADADCPSTDDLLAFLQRGEDDPISWVSGSTVQVRLRTDHRWTVYPADIQNRLNRINSWSRIRGVTITREAPSDLRHPTAPMHFLASSF